MAERAGRDRGGDDKYDVLEKIGQGSFGIIRKVRQRNTGAILCRKEISYSRMSDKEKAQLHAELKILETLRHPNIVQYCHREHLKSSHDLHLYMEYCGNGDLGGYVKKLKDRNVYADEEFVWTIFAQLVSALYRCHYGEDPPAPGEEGKVSKSRTPYQSKEGYRVILHRDLKPENVFLGDNNSVKLGDFGLSKIIASHDFASTYVGTPFYMSPEICASERYSHHSDIWSLGCIIYELSSRCVPFDARNHVELIMKIKSGRVKPLPAQYSRDLNEVIGWCLKVDPRSRPDCAQLLHVANIRLARLCLHQRENPLSQERDAALASLAIAQTQVDDLKAEVTKLREWGKKVEMEWHARATLAIDQRVEEQMKARTEELQRYFEQAVEARAEEKLSLHLSSLPSSRGIDSSDSTHVRSSTPPPDLESDFTSLSVHDETSPLAQRIAKPPVKKARKPIARAKTYQIATNSPADVQMADPSPLAPMSIKGLSLSPRKQDRLSGGATLRRNIFARGVEMPVAVSDISTFADEELSENSLDIDSPSRPTSGLSNKSAEADPIRSKTLPRPVLSRQKTMPVGLSARTLSSKPNVFSSNNAATLSAPASRPTRSSPEKENRPPSTTTSSTTAMTQKPTRSAPTTTINASPIRITKSTAVSSQQQQQGQQQMLTPSRKAPPPPPSSTTRPAAATGARRTLASATATGAAKPTPGKSLPGRTLVQLARANAAAAASDSRVGRGSEGMGSVSVSPAKWDPVRDGEECPSPFLAKRIRC